jgi:hypothetical protein
LLHPPLVVDEAHQAGDQTAGEQGCVAHELAPRALALDSLLERLLDGGDPVDEDVPEQEKQNAAGERAQTGSQPRVGALDTPERQAQKDRESGYRAESEGLSRRHPVKRPFVGV